MPLIISSPKNEFFKILNCDLRSRIAKHELQTAFQNPIAKKDVIHVQWKQNIKILSVAAQNDSSSTIKTDTGGNEYQTRSRKDSTVSSGTLITTTNKKTDGGGQNGAYPISFSDSVFVLAVLGVYFIQCIEH